VEVEPVSFLAGHHTELYNLQDLVVLAVAVEAGTTTHQTELIRAGLGLVSPLISQVLQMQYPTEILEVMVDRLTPEGVEVGQEPRELLLHSQD
jgi:hypothetical protein